MQEPSQIAVGFVSVRIQGYVTFGLPVGFNTGS